MQPPTSCPATVRAAFLLAMCLAPASALAQSNQEPKVDVAVGYERMHSLRTDGDFGPGVYVAIEGTYPAWLTVLGRFSATTSTQPPHFFGDPSDGGGAYLAGTRLHPPGAHGVVPFAEILAGIAQLGDDHAGYGAFAFQPGIGVDLAVRRHVMLRTAAGYRWMAGVHAATGATTSATVLSVGLVVH